MDLEKARYSPPINDGSTRRARNQERENDPFPWRSPTSTGQDDDSWEDVTKRKASRAKGAKRIPLVAMARNQWNDMSPSSKRRRSPLRLPSSRMTLEEWEAQDEAEFKQLLKKYIFWCCFVATTVILTWFLWLSPMYTEYLMLSDSILSRVSSREDWFGGNMHVELKNVLQLRRLDEDLMPGPRSKGRRLIVVGDVHGCIDERKSSHSSCFDKTDRPSQGSSCWPRFQTIP